MTTAQEEASSNKNGESHSAPSKRPRRAIQCPENDEWILLSQGAEARVWKVPLSSYADDPDDFRFPRDGDNPFTIVKERFSKAYRHPVLDERLTKQRCRMEGRLLEKCRQNPQLQKHVPKVLRVDSPLLFLEYIDGIMVKQFINEKLASLSNKNQVLKAVASQIGQLIGHLHAGGITHGDLTTSNILMVTTSEETESESPSQDFSLVLIDFGLARNINQQKAGRNNSSSNNNKHATVTNMEDKAVDLYVLERALQSTHPQLPSSFWSDIETAYVTVQEPEYLQQKELQTYPVLKRLDQVRQRGRKRECFG